ncbi:hypothetical protein IWX49DRAFT_570206 [Phyllosticta citricarpa]
MVMVVVVVVVVALALVAALALGTLALLSFAFLWACLLPVVHLICSRSSLSLKLAACIASSRIAPVALAGPCAPIHPLCSPGQLHALMAMFPRHRHRDLKIRHDELRRRRTECLPTAVAVAVDNAC